MLSIVAGGILGFLIVVIINTIRRHTWRYPMNLDGVDVFGVVFLFLVLGALFAIICGPETEALQTITHTPIYNISDNMTTEGSFVLGAGSVESDMVYFFYTKHGDGYLLSSRNSNCVIYMDEEEVPYVKDSMYSRAEHSGVEWYFFINVSTKWQECEIHIPTGSIISSFVLDAK